jgi:peptidoglycan/LPS O-acetylase OafA/YrhL
VREPLSPDRSHTTVTSSVRIPELDGIRGTAIAMVLTWHFFVLGAAASPAAGTFLSRSLIPFRMMWTGVDLFFVLSGFLIGGILLDAQKSTNYFQVFYIRRFFRIIPLYAAVLLVFPVLLFAAEFLPKGTSAWLGQDLFPWYSFWTFTQNFWMAHVNTPGAHIAAVTWSLAVEEQFYLTLPLIIRFFTGRRLLLLVVAGICLAPILRTVILLNSPENWVAAFVLMPCRADALLFGVLAAILLRQEQVSVRLQNATRYFGILFLVQLLGVGYLLIKSSSMYDPLMQKIGYTWVAFFYATILVFVLTHRESLLGSVFRNRLLQWFGMLAYGTYLIHQAVLGFVFALIWGRPPEITGMYTLFASVGSLALTLLIAALSWRCFELPLIRVGHRASFELQDRREINLVQASTD